MSGEFNGNDEKLTEAAGALANQVLHPLRKEFNRQADLLRAEFVGYKREITGICNILEQNEQDYKNNFDSKAT